MAKGAGEPEGLGGWLIWLAIALFIMPIRLALSLKNDFQPFFQKGYWELLTTPGSEVYHQLWAPLILSELAVNTFFVIFNVVLIFLFFKKSYRFPALFILFLATNLLAVVGDFFFTNLIPAAAAESDLELLMEPVRAMIGAAVWIPYFLVSKRVKNTFVKQKAVIGLPSTP